MFAYRVCNWNDVFENSRSREIKRLSFVSIPNKHDSDGYTWLLDHPDGPSHYAAWVVIVQVASKCDVRGTLLRAPQKSHDASSLARVTRFPPAIIEKAIPRLLEIGWLERISLDGKVLTSIPQEGAGIPHSAADRTGQDRTGQDRTGQDRTEQDRTEQDGKGKKKGFAAQTPLSGKPDLVAGVRAVFDHYRIYHPRAHPKPTSRSKEWKKIRDRLIEGYTVENLIAAIDGNHRSPFHDGENEGGRKYHTLGLIVRDADKVNQFMEVPEHSPVLSEKEIRGQRAAQNFLERTK